jgi:large subunit ribosomal protein L10
MARPEKVAVVDEIQAKLAEADAALLTEYRGLTVHELAGLRGQLRGAGTEYKVFKNTLARRAVDAAGLDGVSELLVGPVAIAFVRGDAAAAAKALRDFSRTNPNLVLKGGLLGTRRITPPEVEALAELPSREILLAQVAGGFQAPLAKAAGLFQAMTRNVAYGIKALIDQRVAGGEAAPAEVAAEAAAEAPGAEAEAPEAAVAEEPEESPAAEASDAAPETEAADAAPETEVAEAAPDTDTASE